MTKKTKTIIASISLSLIGIITLTGLYVYSIIYTKFECKQAVYIYIDDKKNYSSILQQIKDVARVESISNFEILASFMKYPQNIKNGRYLIKPKMSIYEAINTLRRGQQAPVRLTFNNIRLKQDLAKRLSEQLMLSEKDIFQMLQDSSICSKYGFDNQTIISMFIPNTYEIYWDITPLALLDRMKKEYDKFWSTERLTKAQTQNLTPIQVSTLASIVEEECFFIDEYSTVAGLYLNRLHNKQLLQADPTVKFAVGDFSLKRILNIHLKTDSPYNTYQNSGLPPGPIRIPSIKGIDAVLNPKKHNYLYMCAKEDFSGRHNFAETLTEHARNAAKYHAALNKRKIQ